MISTWPDLRSQLAQGTSDQMATWPKVWPKVKLTWSLILGIHLTNISLTWSLYKCQPDPDPHPDRYIWPNVNLTWSLTKCQPYPRPQWGHMTKCQPDLKSDQMSAWPKALSFRYIWPNINLTQCLTKCQLGPISHLTKRCQPDLTWSFNLQGIHLTKCQPDTISHLTKWYQPDLT